MRATSIFRSSLMALLTFIGVTFGSAAYADSGRISFKVLKAGFVIGGSAGSGVLSFHGSQYPLQIGGLSYGFTFGASETHFRGLVSNIRRPSDVSGVYAAGKWIVYARRRDERCMPLYGRGHVHHIVPGSFPNHRGTRDWWHDNRHHGE